MTPPGAFESEGWIEEQARIAHALDKLRADRKQQHVLTRHFAEHTQEALECGATREQIADALDMCEHASPEHPRRHVRRAGSSVMTVQLPDADRAAIQHQIQHRWADTLGTPMSDAQGPPPTGGAEPATSEAAMTTLTSPHLSPLTVLIDDSREFRDERPALVARSSQEALSLLEALRGRWIDHLWLDHDLGGGDTIRPVVDVMVQLASTGSPLNVGQIHIHTANVGAGHEMGVDLRAAGYAVVRSYSRGRHAVGKVFWPAQTSNIAIVNQLRAMAGLPSNVHDADGAVAERALRLVTDEDEPTALDRA